MGWRLELTSPSSLRLHDDVLGGRRLEGLVAGGHGEGDQGSGGLEVDVVLAGPAARQLVVEGQGYVAVGSGILQKIELNLS